MNPNLLSEKEMIALLRGGEQRELLSGYFGPGLYNELRGLARAHPPLGQRRVYLLPGFMGTRLIAGAQSRLIWLDPALVIKGELSELALPSRARARVLGALLPGCLKLKLSLENAGFDVRVFSYDWRAGIAHLGRALAAQIDADAAEEVMLVAHSMGGLVARAALTQSGGRKIGRLVQLGTPNLGAFALVQALRAVYPTVLKLAALDRRHTPVELTRDVFRTLPSVYEMLPRSELAPHMNFFDPDSWPRDALPPDRRLLRRARLLPAHLAEADRRCHCIVGVGQRTNIGVDFEGAEPRYRFSRDGDGTVPSSSAAWKDANIWYADASHGELAKSTDVCAAVVDILKRGTTRRLWKKSPAGRSPARMVPESKLRAVLQGKVQWEHLPAEERRRLLEPQISAAFRAQCRPQTS